MTQTLLTGGTGILGGALQSRLRESGRSVRATSRSPPAETEDDIEWIAMDLTDGTGIEAALDGVDVVIHTATAPKGETEAVDVEGTERLLSAASNAGVSNFLYVSIVGIEDIPFSYYQQKLRAERLVTESAVPTTILRATQFHQFIHELLELLSWFPLWPLPTKLRLQPIDVGDVASAVCEHATAEPSGRVPDVGGPELLTLGEIAISYRDARGLRRPVVCLPVPGSVASAFRAGNATCPDRPLEQWRGMRGWMNSTATQKALETRLSTAVCSLRVPTMQPKDLSTHSVYRAGRGIEEVARELGLDPGELIKLSSNENPLGPSPAAVEAISESAGHSHTYPKAAHTDLTDAIAGNWNVRPQQIWLANGGDGALDYLARAFLSPGDGVLVPDPGFAYYPMSARYHHGTVGTYQLQKADDFEQTAETVLDAYDGERIIYITSPHNPTGRELAHDELRDLADRTDDSTLVLVDEAYAEFSETDSAIDLLRKREDIAVLRTFSKAYGLAGVRLGYLVAPRAWANAYTRVRTPFAASELACRAGLAALEDEAHVEQTVELVRWARAYMHEELTVRTWPSGGNFVLAEVGDAGAVATASQQRGVIVRDCTSFGLSGCVRISCGTREQTKLAVETINEVA